MKKFNKKILHKQLALASLFGAANALTFGSSIYVSNGGIWSGDVSVTADTRYSVDGGGYGMVGVFNPVGSLPAPGSETYINLGSGSEIQSIDTGTSAQAYGIVLQSDGAKLSADNLNMTVKGGEYAAGMRLSGKNSTIDLGSNSKISVDAGYSKGIEISAGSSLVADKLSISTTGMGYGMQVHAPYYVADAANPIQTTSVDLGSESSIQTLGDNANGLWMGNVAGQANTSMNLAEFKATKLSITTAGNNSNAIETYASADINLGSGSNIQTTGNLSHGINLKSVSTLKADALNITVKGANSVGLIAENTSIYTTKTSTATIGADSHITSEQSSAIQSGYKGSIDFKGSEEHRNTVSAAGSSSAISASYLGAVNLDYTDVSMSGSDGSSILSAVGTINAANSNLTGTAGVIGVDAKYIGTINLSGETSINMASPAEIAMRAVESGSSINGTGKMNVTGGIFAGDTGIVDLNMDAGSLLTGKTDTASDTGTVNLALSGSRWEMTEDSNLSKLALDDSTVNFTENKVGSILTTKELSGSGTFLMQVDTAGVTGDLLKVTETSSGNHHITAQNNGAAATTGNELLTIVETADGGAAFDLTNQVEVGGYVYDLRKKDNNTDWELYSVPQSKSGGDGGGTISTTANASASFLNASYLMNYAETQTLLQRMGDLRQAENSEGDVWARAYTGKFDSFDSGKLSSFDMDYTGVQVGADKRLDVTGGDLYVGAMAGASQADPKFVSGDGNLKSYNLGLYGTYVTDNGFYVDGVVKYTHMKNKFNNVLDTQGNSTSGDAATDGYGVSLEAGKRFYLDESKSGFYIEPQAQLSYSHQGSASTTASNGLVTTLDAYDSTIARVSALAGYAVKEGANPVNVYVKTGYVTELSGNTNYALNGHKESNDFGGSWWENGVGVTAQINKKHNLYLEGTYAKGSRFDQTQVNAGYRYSF